jgi:hypothetical protein
MENTPFGGFSAGLRRSNQLAAVAEFWFSADWPPYLPNLNLLDFSTGSVLRPKDRLCLTLIWRPYIRPSLRNNTGKWQYRSAKHAALSAATTKPSLRNMK